MSVHLPEHPHVDPRPQSDDHFLVLHQRTHRTLNVDTLGGVALDHLGDVVVDHLPSTSVQVVQVGLVGGYVVSGHCIKVNRRYFPRAFDRLLPVPSLAVVPVVVALRLTRLAVHVVQVDGVEREAVAQGRLLGEIVAGHDEVAEAGRTASGLGRLVLSVAAVLDYVVLQRFSAVRGVPVTVTTLTGVVLAVLS